MDLIDKITQIIKETEGLHRANVELTFDNQKNVVGYITDDKFKSLSNENSQKLIWTSLKKKLDANELIKVIAIFHETPLERVERLTGYKPNDAKTSNFWFHQTPELAKYWLFIDVGKFGDEFKSFFIIISEKNKIKEGLTFTYSKEVLNFMELEQNEIFFELYSNTFRNAESVVKLGLMNKYESLLSQQLYGKANMYWYVFEDFKFTSVTKNQLIFTEKEISMIEQALHKLKDNYKIKNDIESAIKISKIINQNKKEIK
jgi:hypothetical protein